MKHTLWGLLTCPGPFPGSAPDFVSRVWYFFFSKEGPKFHKLQVPQNLNLFQAEKVERLKMQNSGEKGGLQTRPAPDVEWRCLQQGIMNQWVHLKSLDQNDGPRCTWRRLNPWPRALPFLGSRGHPEWGKYDNSLLWYCMSQGWS